jgi:hypothetical protein
VRNRGPRSEGRPPVKKLAVLNILRPMGQVRGSTCRLGRPDGAEAGRKHGGAELNNQGTTKGIEPSRRLRGCNRGDGTSGSKVWRKPYLAIPEASPLAMSTRHQHGYKASWVFRHKLTSDGSLDRYKTSWIL